MNLSFLFNQFEITTLFALFAISIVGAMVRGFSGFGAGLIIMPVATAVIDPKLAVATFLIVDFFITLPLVPGAMKKCDWPTVIPAAIGSLLFIPLGAYVLINSDPTIVRWGISVMIFLMLALLLSGWRYRGAPNAIASIGVGGTAGFLGGLAQIPGPPIVTYWMSGPYPAAIIRANLITFFVIEAFMSTGTYFANSLFTSEALILILLLSPTYALAVWIGAKLHGQASEKTFRTLAYILIAISGITSLPVLDGLLRGG